MQIRFSRLRDPGVLQALALGSGLTITGSSLGLLAALEAAPWVLLGVGLLCGLFLAWWFSQRFLRPTKNMCEELERTVDRAAMMQGAIHPALAMVIDEFIRQRTQVRQALNQFIPASGQNAPGPLPLPAKALGSFLRDLHGDLESRIQILQTVLAANETVGLRLDEVRRQLGDLEALVGESRPVTPSVRSELEEKAASLPDLSSKTGDQRPLYKPLDTNWVWPSGSEQELLPDFKLPKDELPRRFSDN